MMGERRVDQAALFYEFSLDRHLPSDHLLRSIDRFVDLEELRAGLAPFYSLIGRPSIDPELLIRMLLVGPPLPGPDIRGPVRTGDNDHCAPQVLVADVSALAPRTPTEG
jgi:hypothetical protein